MDKFVKDAFKKADDALTEKAAKAFAETMAHHEFGIKMNCCLCVGIKEMALLIKAVEDAGMKDVLKRYEGFLLSGGFKYGFDEGRKSMLKDNV